MDRAHPSAHDLTAGDIDRVRRTLTRIDAHADEIFRRFYELLFERAPHVKELFVRNAPGKQAEMFKETLYLIGDRLDDAPWLARTLEQLGKRHGAYGVTAEMYESVGGALMATLAECLGAEWTEELELAWLRVFAVIRDGMLEPGR